MKLNNLFQRLHWKHFRTLKKAKISRHKKSVLVAAFLFVFVIAYMTYSSIVLAWVDWTPITRFEVGKSIGSYKKELNAVIQEKLLEKEAERKSIVVSEEEVSERIKKIEQLRGGADKVAELLKNDNIPETQFKDQVKLQLLYEKTFIPSITEEEIKEYREKNKDQFPNMSDHKDMPTMEMDINNAITNKLKAEKYAQNYTQFFKEVDQKRRVKYVKGLSLFKRPTVPTPQSSSVTTQPTPTQPTSIPTQAHTGSNHTNPVN